MKDHKLAAIVFTDIVGYTKRMESDEAGTMELLSKQREIIFPMVKEFGGEVIKEIGDGLMMMFTSANRAVRFSMAVQERLKDDDLTIRAGIHIGDVIFEEGDVFGSAVNIAARIEPLAPAGGICISEDVRSQIRNQRDIRTASIGKKELKGVEGAIEIYRVISGETYDADIRVPFFKDMWSRRVLQILGIYLLLSYLIRMGMGYIVHEYMLSPHLTNLIWYIMLSLVPSIILISYFHGKKGVSKWTRLEIMGLSLNVIAAVLVLFIVFNGKDLGARTTKLIVENEDGEKIEKLVVKNEFRKKIYLFFVENNTGDTAYDYLQYAIPELTEYDLSQDLLLTSRTIITDYAKILESGIEDPLDMPITLMTRIAEKKHMNFFMTAELNQQQNEFLLDAKIYNTQLSRQIAEISIHDLDPFSLVDQLSVEIKRALDLPESHIAETPDFPVNEIFTGSEKALNYFIVALMKNAAYNWDEKVRYLELAVSEDKDFAIAYMILAIAYLDIGNIDAALNALNDIKDHLMYKLTERHQFSVKYMKYILSQQPEKALAIVKMWTNLYPDDIAARITLAARYAVKNMIPEAISERKKIVHLDPEQYESLCSLGDLYLQMGDFDSSLMYYQQYQQHYQQQAKSYRKLGEYYHTLGEMELARDNYQSALFVADISEKIQIQISLANILMNTGDFEKAYKEYNDALDASKSPSDSLRVFSALQNYHLTKGQVKESLEMYKRKIEKSKIILTPTEYMAQHVTSLRPYINAAKTDQAIKILEEYEQKLESPLDKLLPFGYMIIYAELGEVEKAEEAMHTAENFIVDFGQEIMMTYIFSMKGKLHENLGEYQEAIDNYYKYCEINPTNYYIKSVIARCYRHLKDYKKAEEEINISLKYHPYSPSVNYEAALLFLDRGKEDKGMEYLQRTVDIWKDADPEYEKANIAKMKLDSIIEK